MPHRSTEIYECDFCENTKKFSMDEIPVAVWGWACVYEKGDDGELRTKYFCKPSCWKNYNIKFGS